MIQRSCVELYEKDTNSLNLFGYHFYNAKDNRMLSFGVQGWSGRGQFNFVSTVLAIKQNS